MGVLVGFGFMAGMVVSVDLVARRMAVIVAAAGAMVVLVAVFEMVTVGVLVLVRMTMRLITVAVLVLVLMGVLMTVFMGMRMLAFHNRAPLGGLSIGYPLLLYPGIPSQPAVATNDLPVARPTYLCVRIETPAAW